ncbi:uncharacterized protein EV422DRAFT_488545, partial [Fimicolochytrium jonesii]|uniref:uncharacterized protein n=1 Tax=Fimicolochytrium jonesii TaxID=1396493 RepID=UPI0022FE1D4B
YSDAASFEAYILNQFDSNPAGQAAFRNQYGCPTYAGAGRRYHISVLCGSIIASATSGANSCNPGTAPPIPLCKATADAAIASLNKIFADNSVCPAGQARTLDAATQAYASRFVIFDSLPHLTSSVNCIPALDDEWAMCGFAAEADASKYCSDASTKADACCTAHQAKLAGQPISVPNGVTVVDPITTAGAPTTDAPSSGSSKPAAPTGFSATQSNFSNHSTPTLTRGLSSRQNTASSKTNLLQRNASERSLPMRQNTFNGEQGTLGAAAMMGVAAPREDVGEPIQIAETMEVVYNYVPNLADEIYLYIGDPVIVKCKFDDGWGYGFNMTTKQEGSFPLACVDTYGTA